MPEQARSLAVLALVSLAPLALQVQMIGCPTLRFSAPVPEAVVEATAEPVVDNPVPVLLLELHMLLMVPPGE